MGNVWYHGNSQVNVSPDSQVRYIIFSLISTTTTTAATAAAAATVNANANANANITTQYAICLTGLFSEVTPCIP